MIGLSLSNTHLLGHRGLKRMMLAMDSYYLATMYTKTRNLVSGCYSCFLSYKGTRKTQIGIYPTSSRPMQEVYCDLAQKKNSYPVNGYSHLLIVTWPLSKCTLNKSVEKIKLRQRSNCTGYMPFL